MPTRVPRQCRIPGCAEFAYTREGYCAEHLKSAPKHNHNNRFNDRDPRYQSPRWRAYTKHRLGRFPLCNACGERAATLTDHILSVNEGGSFWDETNHQSMCSPCHNAKRSKERITSKSLHNSLTR